MFLAGRFDLSFIESLPGVIVIGGPVGLAVGLVVRLFHRSRAASRVSASEGVQGAGG
jgi:hypothetical protein